jgi:putative SOS response-associated peptidase YedK
MSTNNCRSETVATAWSFRGPWARGQRCLTPALDYDEPYWGVGAASELSHPADIAVSNSSRSRLFGDAFVP